MKVSSIACAYTRTFNLGDYNSLKLEVTSWADLEEGDDPAQCRATLLDQCKAAVKAEYASLRSKIQPNQTVEAKSQIPEVHA